MNFLQRAVVNITKALLPLSPVTTDRGAWIPLIRESFPGAWQQNVEIDYNSVLSNHAMFACITLISSDISKLRVKLVEKDDDGIWTEISNSAYSPVLRKPNGFQNRIQFWENWIMSKLTRGNTYVLKARDGRNTVVKLFVLDPQRVEPLISDAGDIFYGLRSDNISGLLDDYIIVPAREIIHDRMNCLFHPLVGTSPIFAGGLAAVQGLNIQTNSATFFANRSQPGGLLIAPGRISNESATRLKTYWDENFGTVSTRGKIGVLGDGLKYQPLSVNAEDAQLIDQLKWTAEIICSVFHVPPYKIGVGALPSYNNIQALNVEYYSQCLQRLIEDAELCLDEGLGMAQNIGTEFDLDGLLRMDTTTQIDSIGKAIGAGFMAPNEGRKKIDLKPVEGGDSPYLQQQNFSLAALARRDAQDPLSAQNQSSTSSDDNNDDNDDDDNDDDDTLNNLQITALLKEGAEVDATS